MVCRILVFYVVFWAPIKALWSSKRCHEEKFKDVCNQDLVVRGFAVLIKCVSIRPYIYNYMSVYIYNYIYMCINVHTQTI